MTTIYDAPNPITIGMAPGGVAGQSWRQLIQPVAGVNSLGQVTVTFKAGTHAGWKTDHVSIGIIKPDYQPNTTKTPTELKFGGASGFTIASANGTATSDPTEFAFSAGDDLYIITDNSSDAVLVNMAAIYGIGGVGYPIWTWSRSGGGGSWNEAAVTAFSGQQFTGYLLGIENITTTLGPPPTGTLTVGEAPDELACYGAAWKSLAEKNSPFFFAWVDETDNVFRSNFERVDEDILTFSLKHDEGQHPTLDLTIINPRVGLLHAGRKLWAWFARQNPKTGVITPLFFGVLVGIPTDIFKEKVALKFIARSPTYINDKQAVTETLKVRPYYDPVWLDDTHRDDPDAILEGWSKRWHI